MTAVRTWPALVATTAALLAGCGDATPRATPTLSTPDAQQGIVYGKLASDDGDPFVTRGCQGCPPGPATPEAPALAPGVARIAFTRATAGAEADIWIAAADGSGEIRLTRDAGLEMAPAWSPDATRIAFVSDRDGGDLDLYTIATDGTDLRQLTDLAGDEFSPAWSPDGTTIAYSRSHRFRADVRVIGADGSDDRRLLRGQWPSWSPDSTRLLVTLGEFTAGSLAIVDVASGAQTPVALDVPNAHQGSWSPDGRHIVFAVSENGFSGIPDEWNEELWLAGSDGTDLRRLTTRSGNDHWQVAWSPDSGMIVWTADDTEGGADLYIARRDGTGIRRLTSDPAYDAWPAFAPTG